jgi:hypothetical protein
VFSISGAPAAKTNIVFAALVPRFRLETQEKQSKAIAFLGRVIAEETNATSSHIGF